MSAAGYESGMISIGEIERAGRPRLWKGPANPPKIAIVAGMHAIFLAREGKKQSYLRLLPS